MTQIRLQGSWQSGDTSSVANAELVVTGEVAYLASNKTTILSLPTNQIKLSPKLGRTPRYITFALHVGQFETADTEASDQLDALIGSKAYGFLHRLEQHLLMVVASVIIVIASGWLFVAHGLPAGANALAQQLPDTILNEAAAETLLLLEKYGLSNSELSNEKQEHIRALIAQSAIDYPIDKLRFYRGGSMGANAFALPDGTIVFTDELITLTESDGEIVAVFGHELGHVVHRHALRQVIQGAAITLTIALIAGDASALGDLVLTAPVVFAQMAFSREFETESDRYAVEFLAKNDSGPEPMVNILMKLHNSHNNCKEKDSNDCSSEVDSSGSSWWDYLRTHPNIEARINAIKP